MGDEGVALAVSLAYFFSFVSSRISLGSGGVVALWDFPLLPYFRKYEIKNTGLAFFFVLMGHTY